MSTAMTKESNKQVARPLRVLTALIKDDLRNGNEASERAGMPYYKAAGEKMFEAKASPEMKPGKFPSWITRNFGITPRQAQRYMALHHATEGKRFGRRIPFESISDFERQAGRYVNPTSGRSYRAPEWKQSVDSSVERARRDMERIQEEDLTRKQEREAETKLGLRLIDIGYKILAKELHPDSGGSRDAMQRLVRVRDRLKASA